ncbi:MAG: PAS domain S-box protein [Rhodospirillaceae bacterium]|nr:PAS domain S-box protein [Rhodospirillaceae bacterium]
MAPPPQRTPQTRILDLPEQVLDLIPAAICVCDRHGAIVSFNHRAAELWGRVPRPGDPAERFCGSHALYRLDGRPLPRGECPMAEALRRGEPVRDEEVVVERPDGSRFVALVNITPVRGDGGQIVGAVNCFVEIGEQRGLAGLARDGVEGPRRLLQALPVAVYTTDEAGRITFYNEAAAALWGRRPEFGRREWYASWRLRRPDGRPMRHEDSPMARCLRERRTIRGEEAMAERPDGTLVSFLAYPTPLLDEEGNLRGAVNTLVDITHRRQADETSGRLASIVESSQDAIVSKDLDGVIRSWNHGAEMLYGYTPEEAVGQSIMILVPPDRRDEEARILDRVRRGQRVDTYETVRCRKGGIPVTVSLAVSPVKDAWGRVVGASHIARDITERRQAQEQQELLLREMNHRVKNLLALASGVATLSARGAGASDEVVHAIQDKLSVLARAHELTLPRLVGLQPEAEPVASLHALIRTIVSPYDQPSAGGGRIILRGPDTNVGRRAVTSLALLLHEFATNAVKYGALSSPAGRIEVDVDVGDDEVMLTWREHGGPPVTAPRPGEGFGSVLACRAVKGQLAGRIAQDWRPEGLAIRLNVPLANLID